MNIELIREYCLAKPYVSEDFPFDEETLVFKVKGKMFLLANLNGELSVNVKCDPENAIALREQYSYVLPGYHMNKKHWNTIELHGIIANELVFKWIDDSYNLVVKGLPKAEQLLILNILSNAKN